MSEKKNYENYVAIDLELNQLNGTPKIIEIGIAIGNKDREIIACKSFYVNPKEQITEYITNLTHITQDMVDDAPELPEAYEQMKSFIKSYNCHPMPIQWGGGDVFELHTEMKTHGAFESAFGRTVMNVKNVHQTIQMSKGLGYQGGLAKTLLKYGLRFQGTKHSARDDAKNTLLLFFKLLDLFEDLKLQ